MPNISRTYIGTHWNIEFDSDDNILNNKIGDTIHTTLVDFEQTYSRFIDSSFISQISKKTGSYTLPKYGKELFHWYKKLYFLTDGIFTPFIGQTLTELGYDKNYTFTEKPATTLLPWDDYISLDEDTVTIHKAVQLDFGGIGKGFLVDLIATILKEYAITNFTINAGGDIYIYNKKELIGLENPYNTKQVIGVIERNNGSICASSGNRRKWGEYHHIIHPYTRTSPKDIIATWVLAEDTVVADICATCLFLLQPNILIKEFSIDYCILYNNTKLIYSPNFKAKFYI